MDSKRWLRLKHLFRGAIERSPDRRAAYIASHCDEDSLRDELKTLLRLHEAPSNFLEPPNQTSGQDPSFESDPVIGKRLNDFHVIRRIGAGGMGIVYEAYQENPNRKVAIKLLQPSSNTKQNLWRFKNESAALARLQHPSIANVFACGSFDFGYGLQPWFAMELVDGQQLHHYCLSHKLCTNEKLELLLLICDAVQHAHERGVVHRDLKPANILIESKHCNLEQCDTIPFPKIVDFGLALLKEQDTDEHTAAGSIVGTLSYMSPERFSGDRSTQDARCDVYAIGTIGYEMLAGRLPHESRSPSIAAAIQCIQQDEPDLLGQFDSHFRGDLEIIFATAIEKDLSRRYLSVSQFAADIRRFLRHEPVLARPATLLYRTQKFVSRNRLFVSGVAATILALVGGIALVSREAHRANLESAKSKYEADKAMAINSFITNDFLMSVLSSADTRKSGERLAVSELVDTAASTISTMFASQPLHEAAIRNEIGTIYYNLGEYEKSAAQFHMAMGYWKTALGPDHTDTLKSANNYGQTCMHLRRFEEAEAYLRQTLAGRLRVLGEGSEQTLATMNNLASLLQGTQRLDEAEQLQRKAIDLYTTSFGGTHKTTLTLMANLGTTLAMRGQNQEALKLHQQVYDASCKTFGPDNLTTLHAGSRLGQSLLKVGKIEEALRLVGSILEKFERMHGTDHPDTIIERRLLARIYKSQGNLQAAENQLQIALEATLLHPDQFESTIKKLQAELKALKR